jgi:hypothetical protein
MDAIMHRVQLLCKGHAPSRVFHNCSVEVVTSVTGWRPYRIVIFFSSWKLKSRLADVSRQNWRPLPLLIADIIQIYPLLSPNGPTMLHVSFNLSVPALGFMQNWSSPGSTVCASFDAVAS